MSECNHKPVKDLIKKYKKDFPNLSGLLVCSDCGKTIDVETLLIATYEQWRGMNV